MRIAVGSDHRGVQLKQRIVDALESKGQEVQDFGTTGTDSVDYPDFAAAVSQRVSEGDVDRGILICGTGIGMAITANKFPSVRAATIHDELTAEMSRRHNNINVMCLSADLLGEREIDSLIDLFLNTEFEGGRHERRLVKIADIEKKSVSERLE